MLHDVCRVLAAKQAVYTAVWAINVLKRFAKRASVLWRGRYYVSKQVQSVALDNWLMVQQVACLCTAARREVAHHAVDSFLAVGMDQVVNRIVAEKQAEKPKKRLQTFVKSRKFRSHSIANSFLQFFLTEFDGHGDEESSQEGSMVEEEQSPSRRVDKEESKAAPPMPSLRQSSRYWDLIHTQNNGEQEKKRRKTYDFEDERVKNLLKRHLDTVRQVEAERKRRVKMLEASKSNRDLLAKEESNKGKAEKALLQKRRQEEFLKKLEGEQRQRQEALQQAKEKQRQRRREQEKELIERQEMQKEDDWLREWTRRQEREAQDKAQQAAKQRALRAAAALKKEREREKKKKQAEEESKKIATEKRPAVPRFPHPVAPRPPSASANAELASNPVGAATEASVMGGSAANQPKKAAKLTAEELEAHRHLLQQRLKAQLRAKMMQKRAQAAEEEARRLKVEHVLEAHRAALEKAKQEQRMKRREARRQARLQREGNRQGDQPEAEEDSEDSALDDDVIHAISSAKENYSDQPSALMADFGFEDFMAKPLVQVSWPAPPSSVEIATPALTPAAPPPPAEPTRKSKKPSDQGTTPRGHGEEEKESQKKKAIISKLTKKLPKALKSTPYFQHYVKLTAAGLNSIHDLNKKEFMHLADGPSAHHTLGFVSEEEGEEEGHPVVVRHTSKGVEEGEKDEVADGEEEGEEEDEEEADQHSLMSLIDRAKQSLREKERMSSSAAVPSVSMPIEQVDEAKEEKEEEKVEAFDSFLNLAPLTISTGNLPATNGIPPPSTGVTLDQVLNFHQYRAPPRIPQPPSLTHIPSLAALPAETFSIKSANKPQGKSKAIKKASPKATKVMDKAKSERKPDDTLSKAMAYRAMRKSSSNRYSTSTSPEKAGDGDILQVLGSVGEDRGETRSMHGVGFMPLPPHMLRDQTKPSSVTAQQSKSTGTSTAQGNSSKIRQKLTRFENYEAKLQADYDALRESFQAKLEQAAAQFSLPLHPSQSEAASPLPQQQSPEAANSAFKANSSEQVAQEPSSQELLHQYLRRSDEISTKDIRDALLRGDGESDYSQEGEEDDDDEDFRQAGDSHKTDHPVARSLRIDEEDEESSDDGYQEGEEEEYQAAFYEQRQAAAALDDDFCANLLSSLGAKVHL